MKPKIYDCFCYFNEDLLLELRFETLWHVVDVFVIVESCKTFSGNPKDLNFKIENFAKYQSKIRYLTISEYPFANENAWKNEKYQRNFIANGLKDASDEDWILISDVDEIPKPEAILQFNPKRYLRGDFAQNMYSYYLNNQCFYDNKPLIWYGSKIVTYKAFKQFFKCAEEVRKFKSTGFFRGIKKNWFRYFRVQLITDGGWHFTWIASIPQIILKLESFAHQEFNNALYKDPEMISQKIQAGLDIINPEARYVRKEINTELPCYIQENPEKYLDWIKFKTQ